MKKLEFNQFGIMTVHFIQYTLAYCLDSIAANGFRTVDLWGGSPHYCDDDYSPADKRARVREIRKMLDVRGLEMSVFTPEQMCLYPINIAAREDYIRERSIKSMVGYLEDTAEFGARYMFLLPGWGYLNEPASEAWKRSCDSIRKIANRAEQLGVKMVMEQLQPYESTIVYNKQTLQQMIEEVDSKNLECCVDCIAMAVAGENVEEYYETFGSKVSHVHIADGFPAGHLCVGDGENPLNDYLGTFAKHDYAGAITLEINNSIYFADPDASVRKAAAWLNQNPWIE